MEEHVELLSNEARFRISVCMKRLFSDLRARCYVTVPAGQHVRWLNRRLRELFSLPRDSYISLVCRGHLLPSDEPLTLLEPDDLVEVFPVQREANDVLSVPNGNKENSQKGLHNYVREIALSPGHITNIPGPSPSPTLKSPTNIEVREMPEVRQDSFQLNSISNLTTIYHKDKKINAYDWSTGTPDKKAYKKFQSQQKRKRIETSEELPSSLPQDSSHHSINELSDINVCKSLESIRKRKRLDQSHGEVRNVLPASPDHSYFTVIPKVLEHLSDCGVSKLPKIRQGTGPLCPTEAQDINTSNNIEALENHNSEEYYHSEINKTSHPRPSASSSSSTPDHSADYYVSNLHERQRKCRQHNDKYKANLHSPDMQKSSNISKTDKHCSNEVPIINNSTDSEFHQKQKKVKYQHHDRKKQSHHERKKLRKKKQCELELTGEFVTGTQNQKNKSNNPNPDSSQNQSRDDEMRKMVSPIPQSAKSLIVFSQAPVTPELVVERQESQKLTDICSFSPPNVVVQKDDYARLDKVTIKHPDLNTSLNSLSEHKQKIMKSLCDEASETSLSAQLNKPFPSSPPEPTAKSHSDVSKLLEKKQDPHQGVNNFTTPSFSPTQKYGKETILEKIIVTEKAYGEKRSKADSILEKEEAPHNEGPKVFSPIAWPMASELQSSSKLEELDEVKQRALKLLDEFGSETISPAIQTLQRRRRRRVRRRRKPPLSDTFSWSALPVADQSDPSTSAAVDQYNLSTLVEEEQCVISNDCEQSTAPVVEQRSNSPAAPSSEHLVSARNAVVRNSSAGVRAPRTVRSLSPATKDNADEQSVERHPVCLKKVNFV